MVFRCSSTVSRTWAARSSAASRIWCRPYCRLIASRSSPTRVHRAVNSSGKSAGSVRPFSRRMRESPVRVSNVCSLYRRQHTARRAQPAQTDSVALSNTPCILGAQISLSFWEMRFTEVHTPPRASEAYRSRRTMLSRRELPERESRRTQKRSVRRWLRGRTIYSTVATATSTAPVKICCPSAPTCSEATPWEMMNAAAVATLPMGENTPAIRPPRPYAPDR